MGEGRGGGDTRGEGGSEGGGLGPTSSVLYNYGTSIIYGMGIRLMGNGMAF